MAHMTLQSYSLMLSAKRDWMDLCRLNSNHCVAAVSTTEMLELMGTN